PPPPASDVTATFIDTSAASVPLGQVVTFTATVDSPSPSSPSGYVTFYDGSTALGMGILGDSSLGTSSAEFTTSSLAAGSHTITAVYAGDGRFRGSSSTELTEPVTAAPVVTAAYVSASATSVVAGQSVTFTADVAGAGSTNATGSVTFEDGGTVL